MSYQWDFGIVLTSLPVLGRGIVVTVHLAGLCLGLGLGLGFFLALAQTARPRVVRVPARAVVELFRNIPALIQLIWFFYAFPIVIGAQLSPFTAAAIGITLNTMAYCSEIWRAGIQSIEKGQWEGALAIGMRRADVFRRVVMPQAVMRMLPAFTNRAVEVAKVTSLASVLSVHELMYQGRLLSTAYYRPLEVFTVVAGLYFVVILPMSLASMLLERRLARHN